MAAPSKLTPTLLAKLDAIADDGRDLADVCKKIGIDVTTFRRWEASTPDDSPFRPMAARVRAGMGSETQDSMRGVLRSIADDPTCRPSDRIAAAATILRLATAHKIELTGKDGGPVEVDMTGATDLLMAGLDRLAPNHDDAATQ